MKVGKKIRLLRISKNMTIQQLADKTGMSIGFISNVERDINSPTISALQNICEALDTNIATFFSMASQSAKVFRCNDRQRIEMPEDTKTICELLPFTEKKMYPTYLTIQPGGHYGDPPMIHKGEEITIVLEGTADFYIEDEVYRLQPGDCIYLNSMTPHQVYNNGSAVVRTYGVTLND